MQYKHIHKQLIARQHMSQHQYKHRLSTITTQAALSHGNRVKTTTGAPYSTLQPSHKLQQIHNTQHIRNKLNNIYKYHVYANHNTPNAASAGKRRYSHNDRSLKDGLLFMHQASTEHITDTYGSKNRYQEHAHQRSMHIRKSEQFTTQTTNKIITPNEYAPNNQKQEDYINADDQIEQLQIQKNKRIQEIYNPQSNSQSKINLLSKNDKNKSIAAMRHKNKNKGIAINKLRTEQLVEALKNTQHVDGSGSKSLKKDSARSGSIKNSLSRSKNKTIHQTNNKMMIFINGVKNSNTDPAKANRDSGPKILPVTFQRIEQLSTITQKDKNNKTIQHSSDSRNFKKSFVEKIDQQSSGYREEISEKSITPQSQQNLPFPKFNNFFDNYAKDPRNKSQSKTYHFKKIKSIDNQNINYSRSISQNQNMLIHDDDSNVKGTKFRQLQIFENIDTSLLKVIKGSEGVFYGEVDEDGVKNGKGAIFYHSGKIYQGEFKNNEKQGFGYELYPDGSQYKGHYKSGKRNGKGRFQWPNGELYDGQWQDNLKHGSGLWENKDSTASYLGEWNFGAIAGFGVLTNEKGQRYEGQFQNFNKEGHGAYRFQNGDRIVGNFKRNQPNGQCQYFWVNGDYYKGQFSNGLRHGRGIIKYSDSSSFQGQFRNDKKCGLGVEQYHDGIIYYGNFQNDLRHGYGKLSYEEVIYYEGYWLNNVAVIFKDPNEGPGEIVEDEKERMQSVLSNKLSTDKLKKLGENEQLKILKSMRSRADLKKQKIQKFSSKNLLQRLCQPKKRCKCLLKH